MNTLTLPYNPLDYATLYTGLGFAVFPCHTVRDGRCSCGRSNCENVAKHPLTWHGLKDATTDSNRIARWRAEWPDANISAATGKASGVDVLDVDTKKNGLATLARLEAQHGPIPQTWRARTGGEGLHICFSHFPDMKNSAGRIGPGLDVRADGGYVLLAPSLHASGRRYQWIEHPDNTPLAPWPTWLLGLTLPRTRRVDDTTTTTWAGPLPVPEGLERWAAAGAEEGERNTRAFWLACRLVQECGNTPEARATLAMFGKRCRPPMAADEVERVWASAQRSQRFAPRYPVVGTSRGLVRTIVGPAATRIFTHAGPAYERECELVGGAL